jgi:hypothetical protein
MSNGEQVGRIAGLRCLHRLVGRVATTPPDFSGRHSARACSAPRETSQG